MANIKFFTKGKKELQSIHLRFYNGRKFDFKKSTGLFVKSEFWNNTKGKVKQVAKFQDKTNLQNELTNLRAHLIESYNNDYAKGYVIDSRWLQNKIDQFHNQDTNREIKTFLDFIDHFIENLPNKVLSNGKTGVTENTLKRYNTIKNKVIEYQNSRGVTLKIDHIDRRFYNDFKKFLNIEQKLNLNTTGRYITYIKSFCLDAKYQGYAINPDIEMNVFKVTKQKVNFITLSENEINKIYEHDFSNNPYLDNARDLLIIGVWSGARASDLLNLTNDNVNNGFIEYEAKKTGQKIIVGLHDHVENILNKRGGKFPKSISHQKFNDYIKEVCKIVGLTQNVEGAKLVNISENDKEKIYRKQKGTFEKWELVTSHICRRSFATNHYGKLPTNVLMGITGHSTEKMFLKYIQKQERNSAEVLKSYWDNQKQKKERKTNLKVYKNAN